MDQAKLGHPDALTPQSPVFTAESCSRAGTKRGQPGAVPEPVGFASILII